MQVLKNVCLFATKQKYIKYREYNWKQENTGVMQDKPGTRRVHRSTQGK